MKVITKVSTSVVVFIGLVAVEVENGIDVGETIFGEQGLIINDVPEEQIVGVQLHKYCYTVEKGFFPNPYYIPFESEVVAAMRKELDAVQEAMLVLMDLI